jgi:hypothetical protein
VSASASVSAPNITEESDDAPGLLPVSVLVVALFSDVRGRVAGGRLAPGEGRQIVEHLSEEGDLGVAQHPRLGAAVEDGEHLLEGARHRLEAEEAGTRAEGMEPTP